MKSKTVFFGIILSTAFVVYSYYNYKAIELSAQRIEDPVAIQEILDKVYPHIIASLIALFICLLGFLFNKRLLVLISVIGYITIIGMWLFWSFLLVPGAIVTFWGYIQMRSYRNLGQQTNVAKDVDEQIDAEQQVEFDQELVFDNEDLEKTILFSEEEINSFVYESSQETEQMETQNIDLELLTTEKNTDINEESVEATESIAEVDSDVVEVVEPEEITLSETTIIDSSAEVESNVHEQADLEVTEIPSIVDEEVVEEVKSEEVELTKASENFTGTFDLNIETNADVNEHEFLDETELTAEINSEVEDAVEVEEAVEIDDVEEVLEETEDLDFDSVLLHNEDGTIFNTSISAKPEFIFEADETTFEKENKN
ncbi:MAG: hypothetical protein ACRCUP_05600 [Mycoplasmatales bacterium]